MYNNDNDYYDDDSTGYYEDEEIGAFRPMQMVRKPVYNFRKINTLKPINTLRPMQIRPINTFRPMQIRKPNNITINKKGETEMKAYNTLTLGLGETTITSSGGTTFNITLEPQVPIRVERPVFNVNKSNGATGISVFIDDIQVGTRSQFAGNKAVDAEVFARDSVGVRLRGDVAQPGVQIVVTGHLSAIPGSGESITIGGAIFGAAGRP